MRAVYVSLCVLLAAVAGCHKTSADRPVEHPDDVAERDDEALIVEAEEREALPPAVGVEAEPAGERRVEITGVFIDVPLATACGIPLAPEAYFEFDSAAPEPEDNILLRRVAECLTTGPLREHKVELRGYAAANRDEYNDKVGMSRAESVREFLATQGVDPESIVVRSGGEAGAAPEAPSDWPYERRVDVVLLPTD
ncbi:Outer membrane protein OmpA [Nannocystis exedens]|uniref:Outer membrane protein OmpA n=1 Tax=Nannocystis exedens TaxID=54 RepID=A0A1I2IKC4_9BACT|nr:OmpA family protein [Nannocystis exedens]PCC72540.1 OmpA family protein [Nannocystis exedens]SFF42068.1 Outer membrane protein OmpA [Nannocystis exedens]